MVAGESAGDLARRAQQSAIKYQRKADSATSRARNWARGTEGEWIVAETLAPLTAHGCHVLHDRFAGRIGGNIDSLLVGPGGVLVIDAKHWTSKPVVKDGVLFAFGRKQTTVLDRARNEADAVMDVLVAAGIDTNVTPAIVFTDAQPEGTPIVLDGCKILSPGDLGRADNSEPVMAAGQVDRALTALMAAFPSASGRIAPPCVAAFDADARSHGRMTDDQLSELYERVYVMDWSRGSARRLYVKAAGGEPVASKDLVSGNVFYEPGHEKAVFVEMLLKASRHTDLKALRLPEIYAGEALTWSRVKHVLASHRVDLLVGWRWKFRGMDRLYVHVLRYKSSATELGHIDLSTGAIAPMEAAEPDRAGVTTDHLLNWTWSGWKMPRGS